MSTSYVVPLSEYLGSAYRPDVDYVEGELQERNVGELDHSDLQYFFASWFNQRQSEWQLQAKIELRVQISEDRFRVPDVCILGADAPREQIVQTPPVLCIEILSPADTVQRMHQRVRDFLAMGVREVWLVDPLSRAILLCSGGTIVEQTGGVLTLAGTSIHIPVAEVFRVLDAV